MLVFVVVAGTWGLSLNKQECWRVARDASVLGSRRARRAATLRSERLERELERLVREHRELDRHALEVFDPRPIKRRKLACRDRIAALETELRRHFEARTLGSGASGEVYAAVSARNELCAVKVARGAARVAVLRREFEILCRLERSRFFAKPRYFSDRVAPNALPRSTVDDACAVLVMDRLGPSLEDLLWACTCGCGGFSEATVLAVARKLLPVARAISDAGLVHGDLKPDNILVDLHAADHLRLVDFGIALDVGAPRDDAFQGTPAFASRRALRSLPAHPADDLESLALTLRYLLTGRCDEQEDSDEPTPASTFIAALLSHATRLRDDHPQLPDYGALARLLDTLAPPTTPRRALDWCRLGFTWDDEGLIDLGPS
ncbi:hypothetical protein CTAYLR_002444 [Chrysophaeum taylorii]|uniref:Casein kinase I n=1 Tax=Chrysophaeum taylorii TaxID=2483200 RepID=A0AAD7UNF1_9STRA|nr:hypothetical protein CTAYLR_002444 [Chrysophaeum taylorii]